MPLSKLSTLVNKTDSKIVLLVLDGLGGLPMQIGGLTELEKAKTPNIDKLASEGALGQTLPIGLGITPGSGPAHLALFGYDPVVHEVGRGVLESIGAGMSVAKGDVAARGNFCTVDADGNISDRRAGRIPTEEAIPLVDRLNQIELPDVNIEVKHVKEYRFAVKITGKGLVPDLEETDPQKTGVPPLAVVARSKKAEYTAGLFNKWVEEARKLLAEEEKANALTLRGFATDPGLKSYAELYNLKAACIAVYPMYRGVSQLVGMDVIDFEGESPEDEFTALADVWNEYDFFFVHIKKTDSYGEDGNFDAKVKIIEGVDKAIPMLMKLKPDTLIITGDHSTPCKMKSHSWHPVPFLMWAPDTVRPDQQANFGEKFCVNGGLGTFPALDTMQMALAHASKLAKFGA